jgi:hypothetical protein
MRQYRSLLETGQDELRMQTMRLSPKFESQYSDAQVEAPISLLVYSNASSHIDQKQFFGQVVAAPVGPQALSPCPAYAA